MPIQLVYAHLLTESRHGLTDMRIGDAERELTAKLDDNVEQCHPAACADRRVLEPHSKVEVAS